MTDRVAERDEIKRLNRRELTQHWVLMISLTGLALTGLALFAADTWLGRTLITLEGGMESRGDLHRFFAILLMVLTAWHFQYVVFTERGHQQLMAMKIRCEDFAGFLAQLRFYLGLRGTAPEYGRFTPIQKLQYWGAALGSLTMIVTGLVLWFHTAAMAAVPKWLFDVTAIVHGYEGLILFALLFGWHVYIVHFSPGNFPMQRTFLDGKISLERMRREHPLEYREMFGTGDGREMK